MSILTIIIIAIIVNFIIGIVAVCLKKNGEIDEVIGFATGMIIIADLILIVLYAFLQTMRQI